jgi:hypothetical protein
MHNNLVQRLAILPIVSLLASPLISGIDPAFSQKTITTCKPPSMGEYLLLVVSPTTENQKQLHEALPSEIKTVKCKYLNETVTRIGGFKKIEDAKRWAKYVNDIVGLSAIVTTRPVVATNPSKTALVPNSSVASASTIIPETKPRAASRIIHKATPQTHIALASTTTLSEQRSPTRIGEKISYHPRVLGDGYAVLVDYFNRPELASRVQQVVEGNVGFVVYGQRPYLLAVYTTNQKEANNTLQKLSDRGFFANLVNSSKVVLLRSVVNVK